MTTTCADHECLSFRVFQLAIAMRLRSDVSMTQWHGVIGPHVRMLRKFCILLNNNEYSTTRVV